MRSAIFELLMTEKNPEVSTADARFFALCISHHAVQRQGNLAGPLGLDAEQLDALLWYYFPNIAASRKAGICTKVHLHQAVGEIFLCQCLGKEQPEFTRCAEYTDLLNLFLEHRNRMTASSKWMAAVIATACLQSDHLWQDLGLTCREDLSDLLQRNFSRLYEKNSGNMKWKKFFYKQLCDRAEVRLCQAPSCGVCNDYQQCFGPEDAAGWQLLSSQK